MARRYQLPETMVREGDTVIVRVKLAAPVFTSYEDEVTPPSIGAYKNMAMAIDYEGQNDLERAALWTDRAIDLLNGQNKEHRGGIRKAPDYRPSGGSIRSLGIRRGF